MVLIAARGHFTYPRLADPAGSRCLLTSRVYRLNAETAMSMRRAKKEQGDPVEERKGCRHFELITCLLPTSTLMSFRTDTRETPHRCVHHRHPDASFRSFYINSAGS